MCLEVGDRKAGRAKVDQRGDIVEPVGPEGARKRSRLELIALPRPTENFQHLMLIIQGICVRLNPETGEGNDRSGH